MTPIHLEIRFDSGAYNATFFDEQDAYEWVTKTLARLLSEYGMTQASLVQIRRTG